MDERLNNRDWLIQAYATMSLQAIALELGCKYHRIREAFIALGIPRHERGMLTRGVPKSPEHNAKNSAALKQYWAGTPSAARQDRWRKVSETKLARGHGRKPRFQPHRLAAAELLGRLPLRSEVVLFRDGNSANLVHKNLEIVSRSEAAGRQLSQRREADPAALTGNARRPPSPAVTRSCANCGEPFTRPAPQRARYCSRRCFGTRAQLTLAERFQATVNPNGPIPPHRPELGPCAVWTGLCDTDGYGRLTYQRKNFRASRLAWETANGPIPDGLWVLHRCDNPPCVRLDHLFLGVAADNTHDMIAKGRHRHR